MQSSLYKFFTIEECLVNIRRKFDLPIEIMNNKIQNHSIFRLASISFCTIFALIILFMADKPVNAQSNTEILVSGETLSKWRAITTKNFVIYGKKSDKTLLKFAEDLEAIHHLMLISDGLQAIEEPERVSIYLVEDSMDRYINNQNAAAFYRPMAGGSIAVSPAKLGGFNTIALYHEYAHHFMLQYFAAAYPSWYIEGRAELVSTASFEKKNHVSYGKAAQHRQFNLREGRWIPVEKMLLDSANEIASSFGGDNYYGKSWLMTHYLTFSEERAGQMGEYLRNIAGGMPNEEAIRAFGDLDELDRELRRYNRDANFRFRQPPLPKNLLDNYKIRSLTEVEAELLPYRLEFGRPMEQEEAAKFLDRIREKASFAPKSRHALQLLGEVELDSRNFVEAHSAADRLISLFPENSRAHWLKGQITLQEILYKGEDEQEVALNEDKFNIQTKLARSYFIKANRLDPEDSLPLIGYFDSFTGNPPNDAVIGMESVYNKSPQVASVGFKLAQALINNNDYATAYRVLAPIAFNPHGGQAAEQAALLLSQIKKNNIVASDPTEISNKTSSNSAEDQN